LRGSLALASVALLACKEAPPRPTCPDAPTQAVSAAATPPSATAATPTPAAPRDDDAQLQFRAGGKVVRALRKHELRTTLPNETVRVDDNYYDGKPKTWRAIPLARLVEHGFEGSGHALAEQSYILRCIDGYTVPFDGKRLLEAGGYLAFADADVAEWEPVGTKRDNPGPYFVVWGEPEQQNLEEYPRPYQLAAIEIASFESTFPHVLPTGEKEGSPADRGFVLFKAQCIRCHAVNQEGGRVGPELNVPRNVLEYRSEAQVKAFIRAPRSFRYSAMPSHPHLTAADLDALVAYLRAMGKRKHDPLAKAGKGTTSPSKP